MTEEIAKMEAGIELDARVAEVIFGYRVYRYANRDWQVYSPGLRKPASRMPKYSQTVNAAWQVVEKMVRDGYAFCFDWAQGKLATVIRCIFEETFTKAESEESIWTDGKTAPEVICKAALEAKLKGGKSAVREG